MWEGRELHGTFFVCEQRAASRPPPPTADELGATGPRTLAPDEKVCFHVKIGRTPKYGTPTSCPQGLMGISARAQPVF